MDVASLGEFGLIERLAAIVDQGSRARPPSLLIGIGDDCAVWRSGDRVHLATTDTLVADVHFHPSLSWRDIGWKALAVNVSDIAAMGGTPAYALVTLCLPPAFRAEAVDELYLGLNEACDCYGVTLAGGDVVRADQAVITLALLGEAALDEAGVPLLMTRAAARAGDAVAVTGYLGSAAAGLRLLLEERTGESDDVACLLRAHARPQPRLPAGQLAVRAGVRCAIDISDGLLQDLGHVCRASGLAAAVHADRLPLSPALLHTFPQEALALASAGGEDYELLLVAPAPTLARLRREKAEVPVTVIGEMTTGETGGDGPVRLLDAQGRDIAPAIRGWDHLRGSS